jgi:hypothetical protein
MMVPSRSILILCGALYPAFGAGEGILHPRNETKNSFVDQLVANMSVPDLGMNLQQQK